jgi:MoaA/NifB/PqqE/SkfB family radical SAM enzyme
MSNFYCAAPWRGLHINPNGDVKTCCAGDPNMLGNLNDQTIEQILHSPVMQDIRATLRTGQAHAYCYNCVQAEQHGGRSERNWHNSVSPEFDSRTATNNEHVPTLIDVRWNITCNLSCNYCGDKCSSKWAALKHIPFRSGTRPYYEQVCDYLAQHKNHIREVALVGGEPLLLPENERLLDVLPYTCLVTVITNASVDLLSNKIFAKLAQRERVGWSLSFDNTNARFEYVRHGANWNQIMANIKQIQSCAGHTMGIHAVYNLYNATRLQEITNWAKQNNITIQWQSLYQPAYLDPLQLGPDIKQLALVELQHMLMRDDLTSSEKDFFQQVLLNFEQDHDAVLLQDLVNHINLIEQQYHTDQQGQFARLWPEFKPILNTVHAAT